MGEGSGRGGGRPSVKGSPSRIGLGWASACTDTNASETQSDHFCSFWNPYSVARCVHWFIACVRSETPDTRSCTSLLISHPLLVSTGPLGPGRTTPHHTRPPQMLQPHFFLLPSSFTTTAHAQAMLNLPDDG